MPGWATRLAPGLLPSVIEYGTDTTRATWGWSSTAMRRASGHSIHLVSRWRDGSASRAGRIQNASRNAKDRLPYGAIPDLKRFYYDVAGATNRGGIASLVELVPSSHVLFGTDFPSGGVSLDVVNARAGLGC